MEPELCARLLRTAQRLGVQASPPLASIELVK